MADLVIYWNGENFERAYGRKRRVITAAELVDADPLVLELAKSDNGVEGVKATGSLVNGGGAVGQLTYAGDATDGRVVESRRRLRSEAGEANVAVLAKNAGVAAPEEPSDRGDLASALEHFGGQTYPFNFVPTVPIRDPDSEFGDRDSPGHALLGSELYHGRLVVQMTTATPMLIPDPHSMTWDDRAHATFGVLCDKGGPFVRGSSIKGMLRSSFEMATNSRYGVFDGHENPEVFRHKPAQGKNAGKQLGFGDADAKIEAVRIETVNGVRTARRLKIATFRPWKKGTVVGDPTEATLLDEWSVVRDISYGGPCFATLVSGKNGEGPFVRKLSKTDGRDYRAGWLFKTGPTTDKKRTERFVYPYGSPSLRLNEELVINWNRLIGHLKTKHKKEVDTRRQVAEDSGIDIESVMLRYEGGEPGRTAYAPHLWKDGIEDLPDGTLCWAVIVGNEIRRLSPSFAILEQQVSSPRELVHPVTMPASASDELSAADRAFGWVNGSGQGSIRSLVRVSGALCVSDPGSSVTEISRRHPLPTLSSPKPQQGRFYGARDPWGNPFEAKAAKRDTYKRRETGGLWSEGGLRGRKTYLAHSDAETHDRPALRRADGVQSSQNRSISAVVNAGAVFEFSIDFRNLAPAELGALVWLLTWEDGRVHRLGYGKPLGFGSVNLALVEAKSTWSTGAECETAFASVSLPARNERSRSTEDLKALFASELRMAVGADAAERIIESMVAASTPRSGVAYLRTQTQPVGDAETYRWFVANERESGKSLQHGFSLPALWDTDLKLPKLPTA